MGSCNNLQDILIVFLQLRRQGWPTAAIHGDKKQEEREQALGRKL